MPTRLHSGKESKELRKSYQEGRMIMTTPKKSMEKSQRRHTAKSQALTRAQLYSRDS